jgi:hypothetical protein
VTYGRPVHTYPPGSVVLSVLEVFPVVRPRTRVCVVRCLAGTAVPGMEFLDAFPGERTAGNSRRLRLEGIEWYGEAVEQLDAVHSGKVTLLGDSAELLTSGCVLSHVRRDGKR